MERRARHPIRLQGVADRRCASVRTDGRGPVVAHCRQIRSVALRRDIAAIRLSYRPVSMQSRRFRADIDNTRAADASPFSRRAWQTAALMAPQDRTIAPSSRSCMRECEQAGSTATLIGGLGPNIYAAAHRPADAGCDRDGRTFRSRRRNRRIRGRVVSGRLRRACLAGRSAVLSDATGRGAIRSIICRRRCCRRPSGRNSAAIKRNEM